MGVWGQLADPCGVGSPWFGPHHLHDDGILEGFLILTHGVRHVQALAVHVNGGGILILGLSALQGFASKI